MGQPLVHPFLVKIADHDRHPKPAQEEGGQLAGHQAGADHPDLGHRSGQAGVGCPRRLAAALADQVEGVQTGPQLGAHDQVGQYRVLGRVRAAAIGRPGRGHQLQRPVGGRRGATHLEVDERPGLGQHRVPGRLVPVDRGPLDAQRAGDHLAGPVQRALQEVRAVEHRVGQPERVRPRPVEHPVLAQRVLDDQGDRALDADQVGHQVGPTPARAAGPGSTRAARYRRLRPRPCGSGSAGSPPDRRRAPSR